MAIVVSFEFGERDVFNIEAEEELLAEAGDVEAEECEDEGGEDAEVEVEADKDVDKWGGGEEESGNPR